MDDPNVILAVDRNSNGHAQQPVIRQRLRPERIDFKCGRLNSGGLNRGSLLQYRGPDPEQADNHEKSCALIEIAPHTLSSSQLWPSSNGTFAIRNAVVNPAGPDGRHYTRLEVRRGVIFAPGNSRGGSSFKPDGPSSPRIAAIGFAEKIDRLRKTSITTAFKRTAITSCSSYEKNGGPGLTRTTDLTLIRGAL